jgi:anaerobic magnesium-protoporphyrin IX monomethyl ester cyclase
LPEAIENGELKRVRGITFREENKIISNKPRPFIKDIDKIPFPSRDLLPTDKYQFYGEKYTAMLTSTARSQKL